MSTETANVVSLPTAADDQQHEKIVKEEDHAVAKCDALPSKNDAEKHEKGNSEAENPEGTKTCVSKSEETQVNSHAKPTVVLVVKKADDVAVQNAEADHECQPLEPVENVVQTIEILKKAHATELEVENEAEKTKHIEDEKEANKLAVAEVAIEAVENEREVTQLSEACEKIEVENIVIENESETQASEACEDKEVKAITIVAAEKESAKADEDKQEETVVIEEQKNEKAKDVAVESDPSIDIVKPTEEIVEVEKITTTDQEKTTACELATNEEAQTAEREAALVDSVKEGTMQCEKPADKEEESLKETQTEEESADSTNELDNAADQVKDRDLVEGLVKEDEYKDIKEAKNDSKTDATPSLEPCKDGEPETEESKDQVLDVSAKPRQKQSGNGIISKVKQSLVKVKKPIIGKSPSSKVLSPEIKADQENVK